MAKTKIVNGEIINLTAEEEEIFDARNTAWKNKAFDRAIEELREQRNQLLAETDFYALSDVTMSEDMETYRQDLRNLPEGKDTVAKCTNATWPTKP